MSADRLLLIGGRIQTIKARAITIGKMAGPPGWTAERPAAKPRRHIRGRDRATPMRPANRGTSAIGDLRKNIAPQTSALLPIERPDAPFARRAGTCHPQLTWRLQMTNINLAHRLRLGDLVAPENGANGRIVDIDPVR